MSTAEVGGLAVVLDDFDGRNERDEMLIRVLGVHLARGCSSGASSWSCSEQTTPTTKGLGDLGATHARWNDREWMTASRGGAGT